MYCEKMVEKQTNVAHTQQSDVVVRGKQKVDKNAAQLFKTRSEVILVHDRKNTVDIYI